MNSVLAHKLSDDVISEDGKEKDKERVLSLCINVTDDRIYVSTNRYVYIASLERAPLTLAGT